jgi:predicted O-methyltransferase YrrM
MQSQLNYFLRLLTGKLGEPFNGQLHRKKLFQEIFKQFNFDIIIETGTFRGSTTEFFASHFPGSIFSIEYSKNYAEFSRIRTRKYKNVNIVINNSVDGLKNIFRENDFDGKNIFIYLDAHWYDYLPLKDELDVIFNNTNNFNSVIMVDDFEVPGDSDYGFDAYEAGTLNYSYIQPVLIPQSSVFFPTTPGKLETGRKQGCVIIATNEFMTENLRKNLLIKEYGA